MLTLVNIKCVVEVGVRDISVSKTRFLAWAHGMDKSTIH